ncbi:MAG: c-type cytochrome [Verrucomicrobiaceae bacterium]|nr:MAG: c-type cytochrome [Verrucomicrobiaceae bacterium]
MPALRRIPAALTVPVLAILTAGAWAQEKKPSADRTANRGPDKVELKFKLPPPPVLSPAESLKAIRLQPGFRMECVASEPLIDSPIAMSWDTKGRLFVVEMRDYMNDVNGGGEDQPTGRVKRLEDADGDGMMDKATVFADRLLMPRSVTAFRDGAIIAEPPNLIFFHDADDDGVAESREVIAGDFGTKGGQPEHMANSLTYCQDNWLWAAGHGRRLRWRDGAFMSESTRGGGQWGLTQDDWGRRYFNYNSDFLRMDLLPPSAFARNPNLPGGAALNWQVMKDQHCWNPVPTPGVNRGYEEGTVRPDGTKSEGQLREDGTLTTCTATCGPVIYRGGLFGPDFQGNAFIPEPSGNLVKRVILRESGGVVTAQNAYEKAEFLTSSDERFRPVNACNGPDGGLYLVDMARGVIQHKFFLTHYLVANIEARKLEQPVNLGRIWRIVPENSQPRAVKLPPGTAELAAFLDHPNGLIRDLAQQALVERADPAGAGAVQKMASDAGTPQGRAQALWTLEGLGSAALTPEVLAASLKDPDEKVRAAAVRLSGLAQTGDLMGMMEEPSAEVRVQLVLQLAGFNFPGAQEAALKLLSAGGSPLLNDAIACGSRGRELELIRLIVAGDSAWAESSAGRALLRTLAGCVMTERRGARVAELFKLAAAQPADGPAQIALVNGIAGVPEGNAKPQPRKLLYLESRPEAVARLESSAGPKLKEVLTTSAGAKVSLLDLATGSIAWPGKAGVPAPPPVVPLTAPQKELFGKGQVIYSTLCAACHQPGGTGMEGLAPPLLDSEWVLGPVEHPVKMVLHGVGGPISVAGRTWTLEMPPLPTLSDMDIAAVLTYVRQEWEHNASPVDPAEVTAIRQANAGRTKSWTADELKAAPQKKRGR